MSENPDDQKAKQLVLVTQICKAGGAIFMLSAPVIAFNLGGFSELLGIEGAGRYVAGALFFGVGLFDFLILPVILSGKAKL